VKEVILSGMRPTGPLHIGHLFGALKNWKKLQDEGYNCFYMIADYHALSTEYSNPGKIKEYVEEIAIDFISSGLDPEKSTIFIQSLVPEHTELHLIFSMFVPLGWLERNPVYKEQVEEIYDKDLHTYGFLGYPVLQAADILIYKAELVPIGQDQIPHLELTREIARRFNYLYGYTFPEPQALLTETPKIPGIDGRKMSKSYNNAIYLKDSPEEIKNKVSKMFTDPKRIYRKDPGHPQTCPVFLYHKIFNENRVGEIESDCKNATIG
jgi:tryptophanyl-tRNA synthetase